MVFNFMFNGINKVFIVGYLGFDPSKRYMSNGIAISTISIVTSFSFKNRLDGGVLKRSEWHRVVLYNRLAEVACDYLKKRSRICVEGFLRTVKRTSKSGSVNFFTEIVANNLQIFEFDVKVSTDAIDDGVNNDVDDQLSFDSNEYGLDDKIVF